MFFIIHFLFRFKVKVGADLQDDIRRCKLIRDMIGPDNKLVSNPKYILTIYIMLIYCKPPYSMPGTGH